MSETVQKEVRTAYEELSRTSISKLNSNVSDWENKPKFKCAISVSNKNWTFKLGYDARTEGGKHYKWVDEGTGARGGGEAYEIIPKKANSLVFIYPPHIPKSMPIPPVPGLVKLGGPTLNKRKHVTALGIYPRNFSKELEKWMRNREQVGGFRSVTEAAIKRALRREGILK
jgi:hypothetical protein